MSHAPLAHPVDAVTIERRVKLYSLAAAAAGVSALALSQAADAEVVITQKTIPIPLCAFNVPCHVSLDLNGDGVNDLKLSLLYSSGSTVKNKFLHVSPYKGGGVIGTAGGQRGPYASALLRGAKIGGSDHFLSGRSNNVESSERIIPNTTGSSYHRYFFGKWGGNHSNRFLGVKFLIKGATHYGWVRITVNTKVKGTMSATITEYGYESVAKKSLEAGVPGANATNAPVRDKAATPGQPSLGMLALGTDGLALWRREETLVSEPS